MVPPVLSSNVPPLCEVADATVRGSAHTKASAKRERLMVAAAICPKREDRAPQPKARSGAHNGPLDEGSLRTAPLRLAPRTTIGSIFVACREVRAR